MAKNGGGRRVNTSKQPPSLKQCFSLFFLCLHFCHSKQTLAKSRSLANQTLLVSTEKPSQTINHWFQTFFFTFKDVLKRLTSTFFDVGPPKESIFLTTIYCLYFSLHYTHYKLHFIHDSWLSMLSAPRGCDTRFFWVGPIKVSDFHKSNAMIVSTDYDWAN